MMLRTALLTVLLLITTATQAFAQAKPHVDVFGLVTRSCRFYHGERIETLIEPMGGLVNPLLASPIGSASYRKNLWAGVAHTDFTSVDDVIETINTSPDLDRALNRCYGKDEAAKYNFLLLMNEIQYRAKSDAFLLTIGSFFVPGALFAKVATKISVLGAASRWLVSVGALKFGARIVMTYAGLITGKAIYKFIQFKRGRLKNKEFELSEADPADQTRMANEIKVDRAAIDSLRAFAINDLQKSILKLRAESASIQEPNRRAKLEILLHESEQNLKQLQAS